MGDIEDGAREAMRTHDTQAPTAADFRFWTRRRRRAAQWLVVAAAAVCVLIVATAVLFVSNRTNHRAAPGGLAHDPSASVQHPSPSAQHPVAPIRSCPAEIPARVTSMTDYWIPQPPKGIDVAKGFIPLDTPTHAVVCAYLHGHHGKITGTRTLRGNLSTIPADLAWLPPAHPDKQPCASFFAVTDGDYYLMALSYPRGTMWLAIPGEHCNGASNGPFIGRNLRAQADTAFRIGHWKLSPPATTYGCPWSAGRLGQQDRFVPEHPVSVRLCRLGDRSSTVSGTPDDLARLTAQLNRLRTAPFDYHARCGPAGQSSQAYALTFGYQVGPAVQVEINEGCHPEIQNGSLQADSAGEVLTLVKQLLGH